VDFKKEGNWEVQEKTQKDTKMNETSGGVEEMGLFVL
jgi:hypothetical protein